MERPELHRWSPGQVAKVLALYDAERRFHEEMVTLLPVPVATVAADGEVLAANNEFLSRFHIAPGQLEKRNITEFAGTAEILASIQPRHATRVEGPADLLHVTPVPRWERGEIEWMVAFVPRVSAPRTVIVPDQLGENGAAVAATQRLAQTVTHEANNLTMIASGYGEEILSQLPAESPLREDVNSLLDATKRIASMASLLAEYGKPRKADVAEQVLEKFAPGETVRVDRAALEAAIAAAGELAGKDFRMETLRQPPHVVLLLSGFPTTGEALRQLMEPLSKPARMGDGKARAAANIGPLLLQAGVRWKVTDAPAIEIHVPLAGEAVSPAEPPAVRTAIAVDDESGIRRIVVRVLVSMGFAVEEAASGEEAVSLLERRTAAPVLVITDMQMPGMTGRDVAERVRHRFPDTPILFVSGYTDDPGIQSGVFPERTAFLGKPFGPDQLRQAITALVG